MLMFINRMLIVAAISFVCTACSYSNPYHAVSQEGPRGWKLVWHDEFDGQQIDRSKWQFEVNCYGGGNREQQCYTEQTDNAYIENGYLNITAKEQAFAGPKHADNHPQYDRQDRSASLPFTSARLTTKERANWRYGRFEVRAKLPFGQGTWPAIWMLPTTDKYGTWPLSGEIDIMEAVNLGVKSDRKDAPESELETRIYGTLHYGKAWPNNVYSGVPYRLANEQSPADDYHVYAIEWQENEIRWYIDDIHYATQRSSRWFSQYIDEAGAVQQHAGYAPFDHHFYLILNLAVGGDWSANVHDKGIDNSIFPQTLSVDYVRVYQCQQDIDTGKGCQTIGTDAVLLH